MVKRIAFLFLFSLACSAAFAGIQPGPWRGSFYLNDSTVMPFRFDVEDSIFILRNGEERLRASIRYYGDSAEINLPVFDASLYFLVGQDMLTGIFVNRQRKTNKIIPCRATYPRLDHGASFVPNDFTGRWHVIFAGDDPPLNTSVAEFSWKDQKLTGTFLTSTGDYRFLEGETRGKKFYLSTFDGGHVFYFTATLDGDTLRGHYYSGTHWHDTWKAWRDSNAALPNPDSLAFLKPGFTSLAFSFPDEDSSVVSFSDPRFKGKVVLVQLMGSWCPNCMDEAAVLAPVYKQYRSRGLEIVALDFERIDSFPVAAAFIKRFKSQMGVEYPVLFAGTSDYKKRALALPQLTEIVALPTLIYCDKKGRVRKIHTGFSGPATGEHFEKWKDDFQRFVERLLVE